MCPDCESLSKLLNIGIIENSQIILFLGFFFLLYYFLVY